MIQRLINNWVYGGFLAGLLLLGLFAVVGREWSAAFWLVALQLPLYMLHQFEEHDADRFRLFVNRLMGDGRDILTKQAVFVINIPGVWGVNFAAITLASATHASSASSARRLAALCSSSPSCLSSDRSKEEITRGVGAL